jgi:hypothetical protein
MISLAAQAQIATMGLMAMRFSGFLSFLNQPLYAAITAALLIAGGVAAWLKLNMPLLGIPLFAAGAYLGYNLFVSLGN